MWKSEAEINKTYSDHINSMLISGLPFDEADVRASWAEEVEEFRNPTV